MSERPFIATAPYYDAIYAARRKDYAYEADHVLRIAREHAKSITSLLDVGCGTGEHLRHFAECPAVAEVAGVDGCPAMLAVARDKLPGVAILEDDMTTFDFGRRFDVVTCLFASIAYLTDRASLRVAVARMADHRHSHGVIVIEPGLTPDRLLPPRRFEDVATIDGVVVRRVTNAVRDGAFLRIRFVHTITSDGSKRVIEEEHAIRLFTGADYEDAIRATDLRCTWSPGWDRDLLVAW